MKAMAVNTQYGSGINGGATDFAHVCIRSVIEYCTYSRLSNALILVDVTTAFARMLRGIALDAPECTESLAKSLRNAGLGHDIVERILNKVDALQRKLYSHMSSHLHYTLADTHRLTWVSLEGAPSVILNKKRPPRRESIRRLRVFSCYVAHSAAG
jgi:hypothetical protein